jgi:hypothetical protein
MFSALVTAPHSLKLVFAIVLLIGISLFVLLSVQAAGIVYPVDSTANVTGKYGLTVINGNPVLAYYDDVTKAIKLTVCANPACETGTSTINTLAVTNNPVTIAMTSTGGYPFVAYSNPATQQLNAIACADLTCSAPVVTLVAALSNSLSRIEDVTVANGKPLIVYRDVLSNGSQMLLKIASCDSAACTTPTITTLHTDLLNDWGLVIRAASTGSNAVVAVMHENQLKLAVCANAACTGIPYWRTLDTNGVSSSIYSNLAVTIANGYPVIVYQVNSSSRLRVVACQEATCATSPIITTYDNFWTDSGLSVAALNGGSIVIANTHAVPDVSFLYLSTCLNAACTSVTTTTLRTSDYAKSDPKVVDVIGYAGLTYINMSPTGYRLNYYFDGEYEPIHPPTITFTPSFTPSKTPLPPTWTVTPSKTPLPPPTATQTPGVTPSPPTSTPRTPTLTNTPLPPLPTSAVPSRLIPVQSDIYGMRGLSIQLDSQGIPVIIYLSYTDQLTLVRCNNPICDAPTTTTLPASSGAHDFSFVLDSQDLPIISFYEFSSAKLKLLICNNVICDAPVVRNIDTIPGMRDTTINTVIVDKNDIPLISYEYYGGFNPKNVRLTRCTNRTCNTLSTWEIVDSSLSGSGIDRITLLLENSGVPIVIYHDPVDDKIRFTRCASSITCTGAYPQKILLATQLVGATFDANGMPVIAYATSVALQGSGEAADFLLKFAHCNNATSCGAPTIKSIDAVPYTTNSPAMTSTDDVLYMTYVEGVREDLRLARCDLATCSNPQVVLVDGTDLAGKYSAVAVDATDQIFIAYTRQTYIPGNFNLLLYIGRPFDPPPPTATPVTPTATLAVLTATPLTPTTPPDSAPQHNFFSTRQVSLTWGQISWATGYAIEISDQSDFSNRLLLDDTIPADQLNYTSPWLENGTYHWRVRAMRGDGSWSDPGPSESFVVSVP